MQSIATFFKNPFKASQVSQARLVDYGNVHLHRMIANNPGQVLAARITATISALNAFESIVTDNDVKLGVQKARTSSKKAFRASLSTAIAKIYAGVEAAYGPDASEVIECFPKGKTIYGICKDEALQERLQQLVSALTGKVSKVGQAHLDSAAALLASWTGLYSTQCAAKGTKLATAAQIKTAQDTLAEELYRNLLTLALQFLEDESKVALYFPEELLINHPRAASTPTPPALSPAAPKQA